MEQLTNLNQYTDNADRAMTDRDKLAFVIRHNERMHQLVMDAKAHVAEVTRIYDAGMRELDESVQVRYQLEDEVTRLRNQIKQLLRQKNTSSIDISRVD